MTKTKTLLTGLLLLLCATSTAQTSKFKRAEALYKAGGYHEAIDLYKDELDKIKDKQELAMCFLKIGNCYRRIGNARQAEGFYQKAIARECQDPKVHLYYADMLRMGEKYDEAIDQYKRYKTLVPGDRLADVGIQSCDLAKQWAETPAGYEITNMRSLNTKFNDYCPTFASSDYTTLYLTSSREGTAGNKKSGVTGEYFSDIFITERNAQGTWSKPQPLGDNINTANEEGSCSLSSDYNTLYFSRCLVSKRNKLGCQLYSAKRAEQGWLTPEEIRIAADSIIVAHPSISDDGTTLYFVSDMPGGHGGLDLWKLTRASSSDNFGEPVNLGPDINTPGNEMFPYAHPDGSLYFSSDGHPGMGGLDIFKGTPSTDGGSWSVENMRYPMNSPADDFGITFERDREAGYFSSRRAKGRGGDDLYMFYLPPIIFNMTGKITDDKTKQPIADATVKLVGSDGVVLTTTTAADGSYKFNLRPNADYVVIASKKGYLNNKSKSTTKGESQSKDFGRNIALTSTAKPITIPNIFYDYDRWELRPESQSALDMLVDILNDNPNITIELASHTDNRGSEEYNYDLSQRRAQAVVNYLIQKNIAPERLRAKGYAQTQPKVVDEEMAACYSFLPQGTTLGPAFVESLSDEQQKETVYQINRRTEFRVLRDDFTAN
ncbi:MAG: OmpA family protein [Bacteroidales bacterium]|nr:OmpA family protein [Bacteroidales bacterium]